MNGNTEKMSIVEELFNPDYTDYTDFRILEHIARNGESTRHNVGVNVGRHYKPYLSEKQIGRRIETLDQSKFVQLVGTRPIRNIKNKVEKLYGLTLKGFFASLLYCELEENYLFKNYLSYIIKVDKWQYKNIDEAILGKPKKISPRVTSFIQNQLQYFFHHNSYIGITLDKIKDLTKWFDTFDNPHGVSKKELADLNKFKKAYLRKFEEFQLQNDVNSKYHNDVFFWTYYWIYVLDLLTRHTSHKKIQSHIQKNFPSEYGIAIKKHEEEKLEETMKEVNRINKKVNDITYGKKKSKSQRNRFK